MLTIKINYFSDLTKSEIKTLTIDENSSLLQVSATLSTLVETEIELLPIKVGAVENEQALASYYQLIKGDTCDIHFIAFNAATLTVAEKTVLAMLTLNTTTFSSLPQKNYLLAQAQNLIHFLCQVLPEDMQHALLVRFADKITMFGSTVTDHLSQGPLRNTLQVHPYPWLAAGTSNVVVYENMFNEVFVALVYNQRRDSRPESNPLKKSNIPNCWMLPEGYMRPKPCQGGQHGITALSLSAMNEAEELILKKTPMPQAYQLAENQQKAHHLTPLPYIHDNNLSASSIRKIQEEIGLTISEEEISFVTQYEENRRLSFIVNIFLVSLKKPSVTPPNFHVDGIEIKEAIWGKISGFHFELDHTTAENIRIVVDYYDNEESHYPVPIPNGYARLIGQAIRKLRDEKIKACTQCDGFPLFSSRENVEAQVRQILKNSALNKNHHTIDDILGATPENNLLELANFNLSSITHEDKNKMADLAQLGSHADQYYKKIMALASAFKNMSLTKPLNAEQLLEIVNEGPRIQQGLLLNKATLFTLPRTLDPVVEEKYNSLRDFISNEISPSLEGRLLVSNPQQNSSGFRRQ